MFRDPTLGQYFKSVLNKNVLVEKATIYFAHYAGAPYKIDDLSLSDMNIHQQVSETDF